MFEILSLKFKNNHIVIEFDTGESFTVPYEIYQLYKIQKEIPVDRTLYQQLKEEHNRYDCKRKALHYLAARCRSASEIEKNLQKKGFSRSLINETVLYLREKDYIDDLDYARRYIRDKSGRKVVGKNLLKYELTRKGIPNKIVKKALSEAESLLEKRDDIYNLALKKLQTLQKKKNKSSKLYLFLKQRGFNNETITAIIQELKDDGHDM